MKKSSFTEEQMVGMLREADRTSVAAAARVYSVSGQCSGMRAAPGFLPTTAWRFDDIRMRFNTMFRLLLKTALQFSIVSAAGLAWSAQAVDFDFTGRAPDLAVNFEVQVEPGVVPGVPVVFDFSRPEKLVLRKAREDEQSDASRAVYRFEWQAEDKTMFYEMYDPQLIEQLKQRNAKNTDSPAAKDYELKVIQGFFGEGEVLQACLPPLFTGEMTAYIVVGEQGNQEQVVIFPEGSIAQCIIKETANRTYPAPAAPFVAKATVSFTQ